MIDRPKAQTTTGRAYLRIASLLPISEIIVFRGVKREMGRAVFRNVYLLLNKIRAMGILFEINQQIGTMNEEGIILGYSSFLKMLRCLIQAYI